MKILVYDVAAESGGALTILNKVYDYAKSRQDIEWKFILSVVKLPSTQNIVVENYEQIKKGWSHRLLFDKFKAPKIIKQYKPDIVLNLQNIAVKCDCKQIIYMHQSLPFSEIKFSLKHKRLWVYQNIIGSMIKKSCKKVDEIIVQTNWIKQAIIRDCGVDADKITIKSPTVDLSKIIPYQENNENQFFYPARGGFYKNHKVIIEACRLLKEKGFDDYKIYFTLKGDETEEIKEFYEESQKEGYNIEWLGIIKLEEVYQLYSKCSLLFASYIEAFGLPLLEAKTANCPIIASNTEFAREILEDYDKAKFFEINDCKTLAEYIANNKQEI